MPTVPEPAERKSSMQAGFGPPPEPPSASRTLIIASADEALRKRLCSHLAELRWSVRQAGSGAEAMICLDVQQPGTLLLDDWLPDLDARELEAQILRFYPGTDLLRMDGEAVPGAARSPQRNELVHALREACEATRSGNSPLPKARNPGLGRRVEDATSAFALPEMIGQSASMLELARLVRLVAPRSTAVLIEGETGTGKEVVANALHRLSPRATKPMVVLNCAAIPEALLEAELFGHARGAFTGAVGARVGRIETAHGGTLFLDEIGEMPLALQAKMLRFLECGELQRVGDNEVTRVDVRVVAATHQHLEQRATEGTFRLDLYHRLAVFPVDVPALRDRKEDIPALAEFLLGRVAKGAPRKRLTDDALETLAEHRWPGNVRELAHVLERAVILSGDYPVIEAVHIRYRRRERV